MNHREKCDKSKKKSNEKIIDFTVNFQFFYSYWFRSIKSWEHIFTTFVWTLFTNIERFKIQRNLACLDDRTWLLYCLRSLEKKKNCLQINWDGRFDFASRLKFRPCLVQTILENIVAQSGEKASEWQLVKRRSFNWTRGPAALCVIVKHQYVNTQDPVTSFKGLGVSLKFARRFS